MLTQLLSLVVLVGLTAASLLLCFEKWGWLQAWEVYRPWWLFKRCDFCAGFWLSGLLCAAAVVALRLPWWWVAGALPAAALCRAAAGFSRVS
ncbi:hypothetical protein LJ737_04250 [Hymenobacter sp. 15J16-1T3B]|uniref:hypothetical protein n=1 Tax=Hymenobacter sp. 15J16-1T3B TaxID=2886941 RepID=UPI001D127E8F|nr:hypothetical protein [Hymenobacter sp. 15J16-1T3B]MCC3156434.1 hypothetical protein [Hymenobacter sp. 15J16-1T3B]